MKLPQHPYYQRQIKQWKEYKLLYDGDKNTINSEFLIPHEFELNKGGEELKKTRWKRTEYTNLAKPMIKRFIAMIFSGAYSFDGAKDFLGDNTFNNIDGNNKDLETFVIQDIAVNYILYGKPIIKVDSLGIESRTRPFFSSISPLDLQDWQESDAQEDMGALKAVRYEYKKIVRDGDLTEPAKEVRYSDICYIDNGVYTVDVYRYDKKWGKVETKIIKDLELFPFSIIENETRFKEGSPILKAKHNLESGYDNQLLYQAIQKIIIVGDISDDSDIVFSEGSVTVFRGSGTIQVVPPTEPVALERRIEARVNDFFKVMFNQTRHMPTNSKGVESANTQQESKEDFLKQVRACAKDIEVLCNNALRIAGEFLGEEFDVDIHGVVIDKELKVENLEQQINAMRLFLDEISAYPTWKKATLKKLVDYFELEDSDDIKKEIDEGKVDEIKIKGSKLKEILANGRQADQTSSGATKEA